MAVVAPGLDRRPPGVGELDELATRVGKSAPPSLEDGHSQEALLAAAVGWVNDPWPERAQQNDLAILFRPGNFEKFAALAKTGPPMRRSGALAPVRTTPENDAAYEAAWNREPDA
jgi:hypothetical protein